MAGSLQLSSLAWWPALALALGLGSAAAWWAMGPDGATQWAWYAAPHPDAGQVWRWWAAALVHINTTHLQANLWAAAVVAAWGWAARAGTAQALAWLLAWPLTQAFLWTDPGNLWRYVGLSATLHAGAAIGCWHLLRQGLGWRRAVGGAVAVAMMIKLMLEVPALQSCLINLASWVGTEHRGQIDIQPLPGAPGHVVAGHAHGCGVMAGLLAAALVDGIIGAIERRKPAVTARRQVTAQGDGA